jgi:hypothetical protein
MAERFTETVQLGVQNLRSGAAEGLMSLSNKFSQISQQRFSEADRQVAEAQTRKGQAAFKKGEKPEFKERGFFAGTSTKAFNAGLRDSYLADLANDARESLNKIELENPADVQSYDAAAQAYANGVIKEADPVSLPVVQKSLEKSISMGRTRVQENGFRQQAAEAKIASDRAWSGFSEDAARHARNGDVEAARDALGTAEQITQGQVESGQISREVGEKRIRSIKQEVQEQDIKRTIGEIVKDDGIESALTQVDDISKSVPKGWTPDEWDSFIASSRADLLQARTSAEKAASELSIDQSREISDLKIRSRTGLGDAGADVKEADRMFKAGMISGNERASIVTNLINGQKDISKKAADFQAVTDRRNGDASIVLNQKAIDDYYSEALKPQLSEDPLHREMQQAQYVKQMKSMPAGLKLEMSNFLRSGDPELVKGAATLLDRIDDIPGVISGFSSNEKAFASQVVDLMANLEPEEAVRLATELTDPTNQPAIDAREKSIKVDKLQNDYQSIIEDEFNPFGPFEGTQVSEISVGQMTNEYKTSFESYFKAGMNQKAAKTKALQDIRRNWKKTAVTGKVMKYAPDDYYQVNGSVDYIKKQLVKDVNEKFIFEESVGIDNIELQSTEETASTAAQGKPQYRVIISDDEGIRPLFGFPWMPDMEKETKRIKGKNQSELIKDRSRETKTPATPLSL